VHLRNGAIGRPHLRARPRGARARRSLQRTRTLPRRRDVPRTPMRSRPSRRLVRLRPRLRGGGLSARNLSRERTMRIEDFARHGLVVPLFAAAACRPAAKDQASLDLGDDLADVGFGESFHIEARTAGRGDVTWKQIAGLPLRDVVTSDGGMRFSARLSERSASESEQMPWSLMPFSPRTRGEVVLAAEWHPGWGGEPVRRSVRVAAAARSRGLPNVPLGERLYLGGA